MCIQDGSLHICWYLHVFGIDSVANNLHQHKLQFLINGVFICLHNFVLNSKCSSTQYQRWILSLKMLFLSVSSRSRQNLLRSRSRLKLKSEGLSLGPRRLVLQAHFQRQKFTKLGTANRLSVGLYTTACRSRNLCFYATSSCIIKHLCYLVFLFMNQVTLLFMQ